MATPGLKAIDTGQIESNFDETITSFDQLNLNSKLLGSVYAYGLECPSPVQQRAIMPLVKGHDVILEAPSGTGKTLSLCISSLQIIDPNIETCQALIITSTTVKARQVRDMINEIGRFAQIRCLAIERTYTASDDTSNVHNGQQFVVASPRRALKVLERGSITMQSKILFFLDEADDILARGEAEVILAIHRLIPAAVQVVFSSIAMQEEVLDTSAELMRNPLHIVVKESRLSLSNIKQFYVAIDGEDQKLEILSDSSATLGTDQAIIFCNTRKKVEWLANELTTRGITTQPMHGDMPAFERADIVESFRTGSCRILLATNMLARGLDVQKESLVVNYELPAQVEEYVQRTSYGARSIGLFVTVNLVGPTEIEKVHELELYYSTKIQELWSSEAKEIFGSTRNV